MAEVISKFFSKITVSCICLQFHCRNPIMYYFLSESTISISRKSGVFFPLLKYNTQDFGKSILYLHPCFCAFSIAMEKSYSIIRIAIVVSSTLWHSIWYNLPAIFKQEFRDNLSVFLLMFIAQLHNRYILRIRSMEYFINQRYCQIWHFLNHCTKYIIKYRIIH